MLDTYFFIKFAANRGTSEEALFAFAAGFPYSIGKPLATRPEDINDPHKLEMIGFGKSRSTWKDGFIFRFKSNVGPAEISRLMAKSFRAFTSWTIFQDDNSFQESPDRSLKDFAWTMSPGKTAQIYMIGKKDDARLSSLILEIQSRIKGPSMDIFDFTDGRVLFVTTEQPARIIANRCSDTLSKLEHWAIIDSRRDTFSKSDGRRVWFKIEFPDCRFLTDQEIEIAGDRGDDV